MGWRNFTGEVNKNGISCKFADIEDFDEIQKLYWDLIEQSKDEPSFPGWKKGVHPSPDMVMVQILLERYAHSEIGGTSILI